MGGARLGREDAVDVGLESLRWLGDECGLADGTLRLVGHEGRHRDGPAPGDGDEQPLDACSFVEAELAAFATSRDPEHASAPARRSSGSSAATASTGRCTTSRPAAAATASASTT